LASTSTGARFAATSGGSSVTSVTISTGATGTTFYYGDTKAGSPTITASSSGLTSATQTETITAGSAGKLAIISSAFTAKTANTARKQMMVKLQDQYGNAATATSNVTVGLASTSTGARFAATSGGSSVTSVTISTGATGTTFYYGDTKAGSPTITASSSGLTSATQTETITAGSAGKLAIISSAFTAKTANTARKQMMVKLQDQYGNAAPATSNVTVGLASTSTGARFAATSGGSSVTSVTISTGATGTTFYYGDTKAGSTTITASSSGLTSATQTETNAAGSAGKLAIISSAFTATASKSATSPVSPYTPLFRSNAAPATSNVTVGLASTSAGARFAATSGGTSVTSVTINAGAQTTTFYYGDT